jgi:predicted RNA methylase
MSIGTKTSPAEKFRTLADRLTAEINEKRRPMTQNVTHKRLAEYHSRLYDADQLASGQRGLLGLAEAYDRGAVPECLMGVRHKSEVLELMRLQCDRTSDRIRVTGVYSNTTPLGVALQQLVNAVLGTADDADKAKLATRRKIEDIENSLRFQRIPGFFPTPASLADLVVKHAHINPGNTVLEPSAGLGHLAEAVLRAEPTAIVHCIEIMHKLQEVLTMKGLKVIGGDFTESYWFTGPNMPGLPLGYDRIVMNPPFERGQDAEHIQQAYGHLKAGGILVAIMSEGPFFRNDKASVGFREFMQRVGGRALPLPPGSFTGTEAFKATGVNCTMIRIHR